MTTQVMRLLNKLCADWGFCLSETAAQRIENTKEITADEFARRVLEAEGMNPEIDIHWRRKIREVFIETIGEDRYRKNH